MSLHSIPQPLMGLKLTELLLPSPLVIPQPIVVVESPRKDRKRFIGVESTPAAEGADFAAGAFEGNPCVLRVINEDPGEAGLVLNYRLVLRGTPGFPDGIEIGRNTIIATENGNDAILMRGLCMEPNERVELEVLPTNGAEIAIPTTARSVKIVASHCDYPGERLQTRRVQLVNGPDYQEIVPKPSTGRLNSVISRPNGTAMYSFLANQPGGAGTAIEAQLIDENGIAAYLGDQIVLLPNGVPFADGTAPFDNDGFSCPIGMTLEKRMRLEARNDSDPLAKVVVLTTWLETPIP